MIRRAITGPIPGRASSSAAVAVLTLTRPPPDFGFSERSGLARAFPGGRGDRPSSTAATAWWACDLRSPGGDELTQGGLLSRPSHVAVLMGEGREPSLAAGGGARRPGGMPCGLLGVEGQRVLASYGFDPPPEDGP
jgi:hypothetical protein